MNSLNDKRVSISNLIVAACFSIQAVGVGVYISYGVFFNPMMTEFGWPRAVISGSSSAAFFISGLFAVYVGRLNDRIGPRLIVSAAAFFMGTGCMLMSRLDTIWELYLYFGLVFGIGLSSIDVIALTTIARWFPKKRGVMTGIVKVGTGSGQLLFPILASGLISGFGWRNACMILGAVTLIFLLVIAQLLKKEPGMTVHTTSKSPGRFTRPPDGNLSFAEASRTPQLWLLCIMNLTIVSCLMSILVHIVPHGRDIGISAHKAAGILSTIGGVSMAGRFVTGIVIDRIGGKRSMILSLLLLLTSLLWLQSADSLWKLYVFACIYGLAHGGFFTVISPIVAELFGIASHGALFGLVVFFGTTGGAAGPILTGFLFDTTGSYTLPFRLFLGISALGLMMLSLLKPVRPVKK
ncbi:MAG: MFS transporter [Desulfobacula sp.]|jgi:MFS family permease